ncbi:MAG: hypothetical protein R3C28_11860 [Pirellulaceae bacterium]
MKTVFQVVAIFLVLGWNSTHSADVDLAGEWAVTASSDQGQRELTWKFKNEDGKLSGISVNAEDGDERNLDRITVLGNNVLLEIDINVDGNKGTIEVDAKEEGKGKLVGKWSILGEDGTEFMTGKVSALKHVAFAGKWATKAELPDGGVLDSVLELTGENGSLKGAFNGVDGKTEIDKLRANKRDLRLEFDFEMNGSTINCVVEAEAKEADKLVGKWIVLGEDGTEAASGNWSASRQSNSLAGTWNVVATVPNNADYSGTLELTEQDGDYSGKSTSSTGESRSLASIQVKDEDIEYTVPFEYDGNSGTITVKAKQTEKGKLKGEWILTGSDGNEWARDAWSATRND